MTVPHKGAARQRSPNHPGIGLPSAIDLVKRLFEAEKRTTLPMETAVRAWGHEGLSGPARVRIGALRQYGLLDTVKGGKVRLSDRGLALCLMPQGSPDYRAAIESAAVAPQIFRQLFEAMPDASEQTLIHYLMREREFSLDGAQRVVKSYRATMNFANLVPDSYEDEAALDNDEDGAGSSVEARPLGGGAQRIPMAVDTVPAEPPARRAPIAGSRFTYDLPSGLIAEVTFSGPDFTADDLEVLQDWLKMHAKVRQRQEAARRTQSTLPLPYEGAATPTQ